MEEILKIIEISCLGIVIISFKPLRWLLKPTRNITKWISSSVFCAICLTFWCGLIVTHSVLEASASAVLAEFIHRKLSEIKL